MNHYKITEDGIDTLLNAHNKTMAAMSQALNIPVTMTPDTKLQGVEIERDMFERLFEAESRKRAVLETAVIEGLYWLDKQAPGAAWFALRNGLDGLKGETPVLHPSPSPKPEGAL
jgi:hypothetical protein